MKRSWWRSVVAVLVTVGVFSQHLSIARADEGFIEVGPAFDSTPCLTGDPLYDPVGDVCAVMDRWENDALAIVKATRGITGGTDTDARFAAKGDIRAEILARALAAIKKAAVDRTADEQTVVTWLQNVQKRQNIAVAEQALVEFKAYDGEVANNSFRDEWCTYVPPAPYENDRPSWAGCNGGNVLNPFLLPPTYPDTETWAKWGAARIKADNFTLAGITSSSELSAAAIAGISGVTVGAVAGAVWATLVAVLGPTLISAIAPFAATAFVAFINGALVTVTTAAQALAAATATMFAAAAFIFVVVAVALIGIIFSALQTFARDGIRADLEAGIATARAAALPDLSAYVSTSEGVGQTYELIAGYLTSYDTFGRVAPPAPARGAGELLFARNGVKTVSTSVRTWDDTSATLEMRGGYLALDGVPSTAAKVMDGDGNPVTMFRAKTSTGAWGFVLVPAETVANSCVSAAGANCPVEESAELLDGQGNPFALTVAAPVIPSVTIFGGPTGNIDDGLTYGLEATATSAGQDLASSVVWWKRTTETHRSGPFVTNVSICLPFALDTPPVAGTELYEGECYQQFATGANAQIPVRSAAGVKIRASVTDQFGGIGNAVESLPGSTAGPRLTLTPPCPTAASAPGCHTQNTTVTEGQLWTLTGRINDSSGSDEPLTVSVDWNDGTPAATYSVRPASEPAPPIIGTPDFTATRSTVFTDFTVSKRFIDETSGTVTVTVADETSSVTQTTTYVVGNAAPIVTSLTVEGCDGALQCLLVPGRSYTVSGEVSDLGVLDSPIVRVSFTGGIEMVVFPIEVAPPLFVTPGDPKRWTFSRTVTPPQNGATSTVLSVSVVDTDGGSSTTTRNYFQEAAPGAPTDVVATVTGLDSLSVSFTTGIELLPVTWIVGCEALDGQAGRLGSGTSSPIAVTGLRPGVSYRCSVQGESTAGTGGISASSNTVTTPSGIPARPTGTVATIDGPNRLSVAFVAASTIVPTTYRAVCTSADGGVRRTATGSASPLVVGGLTAGATYTCAAGGTTTVAIGQLSVASAPVTVIQLPSAPTGVTPTVSGPNAFSVAFTPSATTGGSPITGYRALCTSSTGGVSRGFVTTVTPIPVRQLTRGATYTCVVAATTAAGSSTSAPSAAVVAAGLPDQLGRPVITSPSAVDVTYAGKVRVAFDAPISDGGAPINSYTARCAADDGVTVRSATGTGSPIDVAGFPGPFKRVTCTVTATNSVGTSPVSAASDMVLVAGVPARPAAPMVTLAGAGTATVVVTPPATHLLNPITAYRVACTSQDGGLTRSATGSSPTLTVSRMSVGRTYTCAATATNRLGTTGVGLASAPFVA